MRYVMSYQSIRLRSGGYSPSVAVGYCVVTEHPLIALKRWNERSAEQREASSETHVLTWYVPLSESEENQLREFGFGVLETDISTYVTP